MSSSWQRTLFLGLIATSTAALLGAACSATGDGDTGSGGSGSGAGNPNGTGNGGGTFTGGTSNSTGIGGGCAGEEYVADKIPLDMYIMLDQSGSMDGNKWTSVTQALGAFVQQPGLDGVSVGLQYFGLPAGGATCGTTCFVDADCGAAACGPCFGAIPGMFPGICIGATGGDSCNAADYAVADVEIAPLPGVAGAIIQSMAAHSPSTGTPTSAALQGAVQHARDWRVANPSHVTIAVLATDGDPQSCDTNLANINAIAAAGANGNPQVLTFVIGVGQSLTNLNGIAAAGGTTQAYLVDSGANATQEFLDAMNAIRGAALACSYTIPVPAMGTPDYGSVNVQYTPGNGDAPIILPKVSDASACPADGLAWYYDNNANPTQIVLCAAGCNTITADAMGAIKIVLGCATIAE